MALDGAGAALGESGLPPKFKGNDTHCKDTSSGTFFSLSLVLHVVRGVLPRALAEHDGDNVPTAQKTRGSCGFAPCWTAARQKCAWPPPRPLGHARPGWGVFDPPIGA